jgi:hypothetical protein
MTFATLRSSAGQQSNLDAVVYFVVSPGEGPSYRIYGEEELLVEGGIRMIEQNLERESYWYSRLGTIRGEPGACGLTFPDSEFRRLPKASEIVWKTGRGNPAFYAGDAERALFKSAFLAIEQLLGTWGHEADGVAEAYTLGMLCIDSERLHGMATALQNMSRIHEVVGVSVIKYWYDPDWPEPRSPELVLCEFTFRVPLQFHRALDQTFATVCVMHIANC